MQVWFNTGDAAHEAHIRALVPHGSHQTIGQDLQRRRVDGSVFVDGLGSSEAGYSVFHNRHTKDTSAYSRCVGKPISFAEAAVLAEDGTPLPPGRIGRLGLKSPTLTPGYWNDSLTWNRMRLGGYWLTGDLAHQDEEGNFYHLDRAPDAIRTRAGSSSAPAPRNSCCASCPSWPTARSSASPPRAYGPTGTATERPRRTRCSSSPTDGERRRATPRTWTARSTRRSTRPRASRRSPGPCG